MGGGFSASRRPCLMQLLMSWGRRSLRSPSPAAATSPIVEGRLHAASSTCR